MTTENDEPLESEAYSLAVLSKQEFIALAIKHKNEIKLLAKRCEIYEKVLESIKTAPSFSEIRRLVLIALEEAKKLDSARVEE